MKQKYALVVLTQIEWWFLGLYSLLPRRVLVSMSKIGVVSLASVANVTRIVISTNTLQTKKQTEYI